MPSERTKNPGESREESAGLSVSQILGVLDHLEDCLMVVDTAGILRYWNESSSERFGTPDFPALGRPFSGLVHPEDSPEIIEAMEFFFEKGSPPPKTGEPEVGLRIRDAEGFWLACIARLRRHPSVGRHGPALSSERPGGSGAEEDRALAREGAGTRGRGRGQEPEAG